MARDSQPQFEPILEALRRCDTASDPLLAFARSYLRRFNEEWLSELGVDEAVAHVLNIYQLLEHRPPGSIDVRAFNPTIDEHGYATNGAVVEVVIKDEPFLIDTVVNEFRDHQLLVDRLVHPVIGVERDGFGRLLGILPAREAETRESVQHFELDQRLEKDQIETVQTHIRRVLEDNLLVTQDFDAMRQAVRGMAITVANSPAPVPGVGREEIVALLEWLLDDNFVLLGYREYEIDRSTKDPTIHANP
ncbi:MAG: hypothetical protein V3V82_07115, partial [Acidimicrobiia bacterium]